MWPFDDLSPDDIIELESNHQQKQVRENMNRWGMILLVFVIAYLVGVKFPAIGATALSKVGL
jgi:hypothetical protein